MATRKTKTQWLALFAEQANSGLSAAEFCRNHNLSEAYFYLKRKKLKAPSDKLSTFVAARPERQVVSGNAALRFRSCQLVQHVLNKDPLIHTRRMKVGCL